MTGADAPSERGRLASIVCLEEQYRDLANEFGDVA